MRKTTRTIEHYFIYIFIIIFSFVLNSVNGLLGWDPMFLHMFHRNHIYGNSLGVILIAISLVLMFLYAFIYHKQLKHVNHWNFNEKAKFNWQSVGIAVAGFIVIAISQFIIMRLLTKSSANQSEIGNILNNSGQVFLLNLVIIAPISEELIFRGMFFNTFFAKPTKFNLWAGGIIDGFLFGYIHAGLSIQISSYWIMGIVFSLIYLYTKDIKYSILAHVLNNCLAAIMMFI